MDECVNDVDLLEVVERLDTGVVRSEDEVGKELINEFRVVRE